MQACCTESACALSTSQDQHWQASPGNCAHAEDNVAIEASSGVDGAPLDCAVHQLQVMTVFVLPCSGHCTIAFTSSADSHFGLAREDCALLTASIGHLLMESADTRSGLKCQTMSRMPMLRCCAAANAGVASAAPEAAAWCSQRRQSPAGRAAPGRGSARAARCRPAARQLGGSKSCGSWRASPAGHRTCQTPALSTALSALYHLGKQTYVAFQSRQEIASVWESPHTAHYRPAVR